ncbi:unnamed protein product, partial [Rotaria sordida]
MHEINNVTALWTP